VRRCIPYDHSVGGKSIPHGLARYPARNSMSGAGVWSISRSRDEGIASFDRDGHGFGEVNCQLVRHSRPSIAVEVLDV
jgi:hypothetical protein